MNTKILNLMFGMLFTAGTLVTAAAGDAKTVEGLVDDFTGAMKGMIAVAHPMGAGTDFYDLTVSCVDASYNALSDLHLKLKQTVINE